jgi:hypothetical protein
MLTPTGRSLKQAALLHNFHLRMSEFALHEADI